MGDRQGLAFNDKLYILNCEQENHGNVDADNLAMRMLKWVVWKGCMMDLGESTCELVIVHLIAKNQLKVET